MFSGKLTASDADQYLCYKFGIGEGVGDAKNKNIVSQINAIAYSPGEVLRML